MPTEDGAVERDWPESAFIGGHPALDFVNTVDDQGKTRAQNALTSMAVFAGWAQAAELLPRDEGAARVIAAQDAALPPLLAFREDVYALLLAISENTAPPPAALSAVQGRIGAAISRAIFLTGQNPPWRPGAGPHSGEDLASLAVHDLLTGEDLSKLKQCGRCPWFFLDKGRGRGRRWCDMRSCGNRAKVAAHRARK